MKTLAFTGIMAANAFDWSNAMDGIKRPLTMDDGTGRAYYDVYNDQMRQCVKALSSLHG